VLMKGHRRGQNTNAKVIACWIGASKVGMVYGSTPRLSMKATKFIKLAVAGALIVAVGWFLRGHDILTALAVSLLFLAVVFKVLFAIIHRRRGLPPSGGGSASGDRPVPRPPGGRPPSLSEAAEVAHESAA
jgi:hypothetical protein